MCDLTNVEDPNGPSQVEWFPIFHDTRTDIQNKENVRGENR